MTLGLWQRLVGIAASAALLLLCASTRTSADPAYGVTITGQLVVFDTATPGTIVSVPITGLQAGESLLGLDFRPATGQLYGLGSTGRLYLVDPVTGVATAVNATPFPLTGAAFGFDFNPTADAIRVVSDLEDNFRLSPNTGAVLGTDTDLAPPGNVVASAYLNNFAGTATTTLYGIDSAADTLVLQGGINQQPNPNTGIITTVGALGVNSTDAIGFDITSSNQAFAALTVGGVTGLYTVNVQTGAATLVGSIGNGATVVVGLAIRSPVAVTLFGVTSTNTLVSFNSAAPGTILSSVGVSGLQIGETILGIDARPATAQLYALGSTGRLYTIDPISGSAVQVGAQLEQALNGSEFGIDFNPTVDRLRVVSNAEQNLRLDPDTGAIAGVDTPLTPPGGVAGAAYTNNVAGATVTTLYDIDATSDTLQRQGGIDGAPSPNLGALTPIGSLTVDTSAVLGFDITGVDGTAYAALVTDGLARLYTVNLSSGAAQLVGQIGNGTPIRGLTAAMPGRVQLSNATFFGTEGTATATITVTRQGGTTGALPFTLTTSDGSATAGTDYTAVTISTVIPSGQASASVAIPITDDLTDEPDETVAITLSNPGLGATLGTPALASLVILDNDMPDVSPTVTIEAPTMDPTVVSNAPFITLTGTASDDSGISSVNWYTDRGASGTATGTTSWTAANVPLFPGTNTITVRATDTTGSSSLDVLTVTANSLLYTLAEGATGDFFDLDVLLANPNEVAVPVTMDFLKEDGTTLTQVAMLPPLSRTTVLVDTIPGLESTAVSTNVTSTNGMPIVVERTMRWDATGYGAHTEKATAGPATTWHFAEGSQGFFETFLLLSNPNPVANSASVQYLLENGTTVEAVYPLAPTSRFTVYAGGNPDLVGQSFGMIVTFTTPGVAERAMYFGTPLFNGGHESAGEKAPATEWFLAEGATGTFFTTFILLANPGDTEAQATLTFLPASGVPVPIVRPVPPKGRLTVNIATEDATLTDTAVATRVESTQPVVVERAQYWPGTPDQWFEGHDSFGVTALGTKWGLAEGRAGGTAAAQTYILLANPGDTAADVTIRFLREPGSNPQTVTTTVSVPPTSRVNVSVGAGVELPELTNETFGALITSTQPIAVERALYLNANGVVWAAGTNATATRLP